MEPILNPNFLNGLKSWMRNHSVSAFSALNSLTFFQKTVLALLLINLVVTHATLEAAQEASDEARSANYSADSAAQQASEAKSSANEAESSADDAKRACDNIPGRY